MPAGRPKINFMTPKITIEIKKVVEYFGGLSGTAKKFGLTRQAIESWQKHGVPRETAELIEEISGFKFKAENLYGRKRKPNSSYPALPTKDQLDRIKAAEPQGRSKVFKSLKIK